MTLETDINIGAITEALNGKIDLDAGNIANAGKSVIAHDAMPSSTYDNLTVGSSGAEYTAPADGWFYVVGGCAGSGANFVAITNTTTGISRQDQLWDTYGNQKLLLPVNKGEKAKLEYGNVRFYDFKFYYANGSSWEAS